MNVQLPLLGALLALIQLYDALICAIPIRYITGECDRLQLRHVDPHPCDPSTHLPPAL